MKKSILFFATLVGLLCFASCQKPEGDNFDSSFVDVDADGVSAVFRWSVTPNVDFADCNVQAFLGDSSSIQVFKMTLRYFESPVDSASIASASQDTVDVKMIDTPTTINKGWKDKVQLNGLKPGTHYACYLEYEDFFGFHKSNEQTFETKGTMGGSVLVTTDSAKITGVTNMLCFYGTVRTHYRALDTTALEIWFKYGWNDSVLDNEVNNYVIDHISDPVEDTVYCKFHCSMDMVDSCWYQAYVKDAWGHQYSSDNVMEFSNEAPKAVWAKNIEVLGSTMATLTGNSEYHGGEDMTVRKRGFCYAEHPNPTVADSTASVWYDNGTLSWNNKFSYTLTGLKPNTRYYCRVFLMLTDEVNDALYSEERDFTTESPVELTLADPFNITATTVDLKATVGETQHEIEVCKFLWREINNPNDQGLLTFDNALANVIDCMLGEDDTFVATIENLKPAQKYVFGAYIKLKNGEESYSNTHQVSTEEE